MVGIKTPQRKHLHLGTRATRYLEKYFTRSYYIFACLYFLYCSYFYVQGSTLLISPLFMQSSPQYYPDPEKFNPDNFLPDACHNRHPYSFIPFSAGYRNCIGIKYAMFQMKTVVSTLVRRHKFAPSSRCPTPKHLRIMFLTTLKFVDGCYVKILPRTLCTTDINENPYASAYIY